MFPAAFRVGVKKRGCNSMCVVEVEVGERCSKQRISGDEMEGLGFDFLCSKESE